jgi:hypothetical protein
MYHAKSVHLEQNYIVDNACGPMDIENSGRRFVIRGNEMVKSDILTNHIHGRILLKTPLLKEEKEQQNILLNQVLTLVDTCVTTKLKSPKPKKQEPIITTTTTVSPPVLIPISAPLTSTTVTSQINNTKSSNDGMKTQAKKCPLTKKTFGRKPTTKTNEVKVINISSSSSSSSTSSSSSSFSSSEDEDVDEDMEAVKIQTSLLT